MSLFFIYINTYTFVYNLLYFCMCIGLRLFLYYLTSGYAPRGLKCHLNFFLFQICKNFLCCVQVSSFFRFFVISLGRVVEPSPKIVLNLEGPFRSYPVKENLIGSAVSEILRDKHTKTQRQTSCYFIIRMSDFAIQRQE